MRGRKQTGFTIVELLVVIVVVAILAAITIIAFNGVQDKARLSKMQADLSSIKKAMYIARELQQKPIVVITGDRAYGSGGTGAACNALPAGTDLGTLTKASNCWVSYNNFLDKVSTASGVNIRNIVDPYGWPYSISEGENNGECVYSDNVWAFSHPYAPWSGQVAGTLSALPPSGYCV